MKKVSFVLAGLALVATAAPSLADCRGHTASIKAPITTAEAPAPAPSPTQTR